MFNSYKAGFALVFRHVIILQEARGAKASPHKHPLFLCRTRRTQLFSHVKEGENGQEDTGVKAKHIVMYYMQR